MPTYNNPKYLSLPQQVQKNKDEIEIIKPKIDILEEQFDEFTNMIVDGEIVNEVINARDGEVSLGANITEIKSQLAQTTKRVHNGMTQDEIQQVIDNYSAIEFLDGDYNIDVSNITGFHIPSNRKITFRPNAVLKVIPNNLDRYAVFNINNVENVEIHSPTIIGDRDEHLGISGERGTAFEIRNSSDIKILSPKISDCWGDGIYINNTTGRNILIENPIVNNCRRNGISVISGANIKIVNPVVTNTNGIDPQAGIDIEPNLSTDILEGILIENPITENNVNDGITINLMQIANTNKVVDIKVTNHKDKGSKHGLHVFRGVGLNGLIEVERPTYRGTTGSAIWVRDCDVSNALVRIIKPTIIAEVATGNGIRVGKETNDTYATTVGNVEIIEPVVIDNRTTKLEHAIYVRDMVMGKNTEKVNILNPRKLDGQNALFFDGAGVITDHYNILELKENYGTDVIRPDMLRVTFNNEFFTTRKTYSVRNTSFPADCPELTFKVTNPIGLRIQPATGEKIAVISGVPDKYIESVELGAMITLKKITSDTWAPTKIIGTWTAEA